MKYWSTVHEALKTVFFNRAYVAGFVLASLAVFGAYVALPVLIIPGNSLELYLSNTSWPELAILAALAVLTGVLLSLNWFAYRKSLAEKTGVGSFHAATSMLTSMFVSAKCPLCLAAVFGFLGSGALFFLADNRLPIGLAGTALLIGSIYFSSERVIVKCNQCK